MFVIEREIISSKLFSDSRIGFFVHTLTLVLNALCTPIDFGRAWLHFHVAWNICCLYAQLFPFFLCVFCDTECALGGTGISFFRGVRQSRDGIHDHTILRRCTGSIILGKLYCLCLCLFLSRGRLFLLWCRTREKGYCIEY